MASKTTVCNQALAHLNISLSISDFLTDESKEAKACRLFYDDILSEMFRDFDWPFASETALLSLLEENPTDEWRYAYHMPALCAAFREIKNGLRDTFPESQIPWQRGRHDGLQVIFTDQPVAKGRFTTVIDDPDEWDADFLAAFTYMLAGRIAPRITAGDAFKRGEEALKMAAFYYARSKANAFNERQKDNTKTSGFSRARR